ncbi:MAG: LysR substrate-binding domain-containing protein [Octadecabacter sp.]|nr:LysR substrate-binding domain-containing protein [Octadecabacter sp.]
MPRIGSFWEKHPEIDIEFIPSMSLVDLRRDNIDVAIRYGKGGWADVTSRPLMPAGHVAVAAPEYIKGHNITCLSDLKGLHWLMDGARSE